MSVELIHLLINYVFICQIMLQRKYRPKEYYSRKEYHVTTSDIQILENPKEMNKRKYEPKNILKCLKYYLAKK